MPPLKPFKESPMTYIVLGLIGVFGIVFAYWYFKPIIASFLTALLVLEGWALTNRYENDTISEVIWYYSANRPILPMIFGLIAGALLYAGFIKPEGFLMGFLYGHFFFQEKRNGR